MAQQLNEKPVKPFTGRHFLIYMLLFFGVVTIVNIIFITKAIQSNSGVVTENPYEVGLVYNKILDAHEKQKALGWKGMTAVEQKNILVYTLADKTGAPISGADVRVKMLRPVQKGYDFSVAMTEGRSGRYTAKIDVPVKGAWNAHVSVVRGADTYDDITSLDLD